MFKIISCIFIFGFLSAKPIRITTTSSLVFGTGAQGDAPKTIAPGTSENAQNASFAVSGDRNTAYTILLPVSATMTTGAGGVNRTIAISNFKSYPLAGANGLLNSSGDQALFVGATRAALALSQVAGSYTGSFTMTVVY